MKRILVYILILGILMACGRPDQPSSTGNGVPEETPKIMWIPGTNSTPFPTPTAYIPTVNGNSVEIDASVLGNRPQVSFTIQQGQVLHLISSLQDVPSLEWFIETDPSLFQASIDGQAHIPVQGYEAYPAKGLLLTPLHEGTHSFTVHLRFDPCKGCDTSTLSTIYDITVK